MLYEKSDLFVKQAAYKGLEKIATVTLSRDSNSWQQDISQALHREHPFIQEHNIAIYMTKVDGEMGAGIGSIAIDDKVLIPIIVDKFKMAPLDVFQFEGKLYPLTRTSLESTLQDTKLGKPTTPGQGEMTDQSLYGRSQPPFDGKYTYASLAEQVFDKAVFEQAVAKTFESPYEFKAALVKNAGVQDVLRNLTAIKPKEVAKDNSWTGQGLGHLKVRTTRPFEKKASAGVFSVATQFGAIPAIVADFVFDSAGDVKDNRGIVVGLDKHASYTQFYKDIGVSATACDPDTAIPFSLPRTGDAGVFVKIAGEHILATEPMTIKYTTDAGWGATDGFGRHVNLMKSAGLKAPVGDGKNLALPLDWAWIKTARKVDPLNLTDAELTQDHSGEYVRMTCFDGRVSISGLDGFPKDGHSIEKTAQFLVERFPKHEVRAVLEAIQDGGELHLSATFPEKHEPVVKFASAKVSPVNLIREATYVIPFSGLSYPAGNGGQIKVAAVTDDQSRTTIDAVLGLNFLTPENLHKFVDKVEQISEAKDVVAKLLLASRLGLDVDSRPLRTAMYALDSIERDLRELQNAVETQERTTG